MKSQFSPSSDLLDSYFAKLAETHPLDREAEIRAGQFLETAYAELLDAVLASGLPLRELAAAREGLREGKLDATDVCQTPAGECAGSDAEVMRALTRIVSADQKAMALRTSPRSKAKGKERERVRAELAAVLARRDRAVRKLALQRDRIEVLAADARRQLKAALEPGPEGMRLRRALGQDKRALEASRRALRRAQRELTEAKRQLTEPNLRLVVLFARKLRNRGVALADLIQEGNLGLMRAAEKFDHRVGTRFSTYAAWWIRQSLTRAVLGQGQDVRTPVHLNDTLRATRKVASRLSSQLGREASPDEIAAEMNASPDDVQRLLETNLQTVSMQAPIGEDGDRSFGDLMADATTSAADDVVIGTRERERALRLLGTLSSREQHILRRRFGIDGSGDHTLQEIGKELGLSRERVRQLEAEALRKLREAMSEKPPTTDESAAA